MFRYRYADGTVVNELRLPEEVFSPESLETLGGKPITLDHPKDFVSPANVSEVGVGTVGNEIRVGGGYVRITGDVHRADAIKAIESGKVELSCGYTCEVEPASGYWIGAEQRAVWTHDGTGSIPRGAERFDAVQRQIRHNHLAIVDKGRAGPDARFRIDHAEEVAPTDAPSNEVRPMAKIKIDGVEYEAEAGLAGAIAQQQAKADAAAKAKADEIEALKAERDAEKARADEAESKALGEEEIRRLANERAALVAKCQPHLDAEADAAAMSERDLYLGVLKRLDGDTDHSQDDPVYLAAYANALIKANVQREDSAKRTDGDKGQVEAALGHGQSKARNGEDKSAERLRRLHSRWDTRLSAQPTNETE